MKSELLMDTSEKIFTIDKPMITFHINPNLNNDINKSQIINHSPKSECNIKITNLNSNPISLRVRTTKKEFYAVNPTYCIILPNKHQNINFLLYLKGSYLNIDFSKHKFRFEGIIIDLNNINKEPKKIFEDVINNKIKVKGNIIKRKCECIEDNNYFFSNINQVINTNSSINFVNPLSQSTNIQLKNKNQNFKNLNKDKLINDKKEKLNLLKQEYFNLKNQLDNLSQNYSNIKSTIEKEKNRNNIQRGNNRNIIFKLPEIKEPKINPKIVLILCFVSFIFGLYLTK